MKTLCLTLCLCLLWVASADADIKLSPLRVVLTPDSPVAAFEVSNPSGRIFDGRTSWIDMRATQTGYAPALAGERAATSAAPYLLVSPAHFRLKPGARATITVSIRDGARPPRGERRSHLLIEAAASRTPIRKAGGGLPVDVELGVSAPVILRNGGEAEAKLEETQLLRDEDGLLLLRTSVVPQGALSAYGRLVASFAPAEAPETAQVLGMRRNVSGFVDVDKRSVEIPLGSASLGPGKLTLAYEGEAEFSGRVFDSRTYDVEPPAE